MGLLQYSSPQIRLHSSSSFRGTETSVVVLCGPSEDSGSSGTHPKGRMVPGDILPSLPSSKKEWLLAPSHRPDLPQQIHRARKIQNGNSVNHPASHTASRLDDFNGLEGRLFPRPSGKGVSQISPIPSQARSSTIYLPPLRADNVPLSLFKGSPSYSGSHKIKRGTSLPLPRRPPNIVSKQRAVAGPPGTSDLHPVQLRVAPELRKKSSRPSSTSNIPRSSVRYSGKHHLPSTTENPECSRQNFPGPTRTAPESLPVPGNCWHDGLHDSHGQMGLVEITSLPVRFPTTMEDRGQESSYPHNIDNEEQPLLVASA